MFKLPEYRRRALKEELPAFLDRRFGHLDFWRLSKRWKHIRYAQDTDLQILMIEMEIQHLIDTGVIKLCQP